MAVATAAASVFPERHRQRLGRPGHCRRGGAISREGMSPAEPVVLDLGHLDEIRAMPGMKGGSLLEEFVALFLRDEPPRLAELKALAREGTQRAEIKRLAHTLAGSCAMLGALDMQHAALAVQAAAATACRPSSRSGWRRWTRPGGACKRRSPSTVCCRRLRARRRRLVDDHVAARAAAPPGEPSTLGPLISSLSLTASSALCTGLAIRAPKSRRPGPSPPWRKRFPDRPR